MFCSNQHLSSAKNAAKSASTQISGIKACKLPGMDQGALVVFVFEIMRGNYLSTCQLRTRMTVIDEDQRFPMVIRLVFKENDKGSPRPCPSLIQPWRQTPYASRLQSETEDGTSSFQKRSVRSYGSPSLKTTWPPSVEKLFTFFVEPIVLVGIKCPSSRVSFSTTTGYR